jgi:cytosine/adenosine deaminase-related metal-dependent hydrolase
MSYRKFRADHLFTGHEWLNEGYVLVTTAGGQIREIIPAGEAGEDIKVTEGILCPGFINCHCHLELSHMKGLIPEKTGLVDFVFKVVTERHHEREEIQGAIAMAEHYMLQNGTVATGDICNNALTLSQKQQGRIQYYNFIEASGWLPQVARERFARALSLFNLYHHASIVPHAPYSVSDNLWQLIGPYFENKVVTIHNQETAYEDEFFTKGSGDFTRMYALMGIDNGHHKPAGISSLPSYFEKLQGAKNIILVHNTYIQQADIDFIELKTRNTLAAEAVAKAVKPQTYFCLCINANLYIENALPPVDLLRKNNCSIVLGTDSLASNRSLSIPDEIKTIRKHFPGIDLGEILKWATINGAKALGMDDELGSFEPGKRPGVLLLSKDLNRISRLL